MLIMAAAFNMDFTKSLNITVKASVAFGLLAA